VACGVSCAAALLDPATTAREPKLTKSDWETRLLALIRNAGLPEPLVNHPLIAPDYRHRQAGAVTATAPPSKTTAPRTAALVAVGLRVVRFTWHTPDHTMLRRLRALLE
jgi:hypothetical protein